MLYNGGIDCKRLGVFVCKGRGGVIVNSGYGLGYAGAVFVRNSYGAVIVKRGMVFSRGIRLMLSRNAGIRVKSSYVFTSKIGVQADSRRSVFGGKGGVGENESIVVKGRI